MSNNSLNGASTLVEISAAPPRAKRKPAKKAPAKKKAAKKPAKKAAKNAPSAYGAKIRRARRARDMTQAALGAKCGVSQAHVCSLESGRSLPSAQLRTRLAKVLGL